MEEYSLVIYWLMGWLIGAFCGQNRLDGLKQNLNIHSNGPIICISKIQANHVVKCGYAPATDLPQACDTRLYFQNPF